MIKHLLPTNLSFNDHFANIVNITQTAHQAVLKHYTQAGLTYVDVPAIVGITGACENVDTLFKIQSHQPGLNLFFTQTGQLSLEQALQVFPGACTIIHSGRDEEIEDERHLRQFRLIEEEFDCTMIGMTRETYNEQAMFENLLQHIQQAVQAMFSAIIKDHSDILAQAYQHNVQNIKLASTQPFLRIRYEDTIQLLNHNGFTDLRFGDDLHSKHEAKIVQLLNTSGTELPVFITHYPKEIKFFNMKVSSIDARVCLSADLILPYSGEATGSAVREHDFTKLNERLLASTMYKLHRERGGTYEDFKWYLTIMEQKLTNPHAGYGIGNDRIMQYILGLTDIRQASIFTLLNQQTGDWLRK
ncbi:MAG: amino acid--tRNA ligase-related protein [Patescibacteria group bacterium]|jgi:asparaginyl-tRNA synthetase